MASKRFISSLIWFTAFLAASLMACGSDAGGNTAPSGETPSGATSETARALVGHWRSTSIVFESPEDENLVLHSDGTWENWTVTASGRSPTTTGTWRVEAKSIVTRPTDSKDEFAGPFTFFDGQLVYPNIPDHRRFWERIL